LLCATNESDECPQDTADLLTDESEQSTGYEHGEQVAERSKPYTMPSTGLAFATRRRTAHRT